MTRSETLDAIAAEIDSAPEEDRAALWKAIRQAAADIACGREPEPAPQVAAAIVAGRYRPRGEK